jgi:hypothetical protein
MKKSTEHVVRDLVKEKPYLVEDDKVLLLAVWEHQGLKLTEEQKVAWFDDCSTPETITRSRRWLLEQGLIDQSVEAEFRRQRLAMQYREKYSRQKPLVEF